MQHLYLEKKRRHNTGPQKLKIKFKKVLNLNNQLPTVFQHDNNQKNITESLIMIDATSYRFFLSHDGAKLTSLSHLNKGFHSV